MKALITLLIFTLSLSVFPQSGKALFEQGRELYENDKCKEAIAVLTKAEGMQYREPELYIVRGNCQARLQNAKGAIADYSLAIKANPTNAMAWYSRGVMYKITGERELALSDFTSAIKANSNYESALQQRGIMYFEDDRLQEAIADFEKYITLDISNDLVYSMLGIAYGRTGKDTKTKAKGIESLTKALALYTSNANYYYYRGTIYMDMGEAEKALSDLNKALTLNPGHPDYYFERGNLYGKLKDSAKQMADYDKAISIDPNYGRYYYYRGTAFLELKDKEKACADFNKAVALNYREAEKMAAACKK